MEEIYYQTATRSGYTDAQGTYVYLDGETIRFSMGDVVRGEAQAQEVMAPLTLVPGAMGETDPTVTNMARLLKTMDYDNDPSNVFTIPDAVETEMFDRHNDFDMDPEAFAQDPDITMLMDDSEPSPLVYFRKPRYKSTIRRLVEPEPGSHRNHRRQRLSESYAFTSFRVVLDAPAQK